MNKRARLIQTPKSKGPKFPHPFADEEEQSTDGDSEHNTPVHEEIPESFEDIEERHCKYDEDCFMCIYRFGAPRVKNDELKLFHDVFLDNSSVPEKPLSKLMERAYDKYIKIPAVNRGDYDIMECNSEHILRHLRFHMPPDPKRELQSDLRELKIWQAELNNKISTTTIPSSTSNVKSNVFKDYLSLLDKKHKYIEKLMDKKN